MKAFLCVTTMVLCCVTSCGIARAQGPRDAIDMIRSGDLTQTEIVDALIERETGVRWSVPVLNATEYSEKATTKSATTVFVQNSAGAAYQILSQMDFGSLAPSDYENIEALIDYRNQLLDIGGTANLSLAISITKAIHNSLIHMIGLEKDRDLEAMKRVAQRNQIRLGGGFSALVKDDRWTTRSAGIDFSASDVEVAKQYLAQVGVKEIEDGQQAWLSAFQKDWALMVTDGGSPLLEQGSFRSYVGLCISLIDQQKMLLLAIQFEQETGRSIWNYFHVTKSDTGEPISPSTDRNPIALERFKSDFSAFLEGQEIPISLGTFQPIESERIIRTITFPIVTPESKDMNDYLKQHLLSYDMERRLLSND